MICENCKSGDNISRYRITNCKENEREIHSYYGCSCDHRWEEHVTEPYTLEPYTKLLEDNKMKTTSKIISYLISIGIAATIAFGTGYNETVDALLLTVVWILIALGLFSWLVMGAVGIGITFAGAKLDQKDVDKWKAMDKPKWYISIPISVIWLTALASANWPVTAVFYLINTIVLWSVVYMMRSAVENYVAKPDIVEKLRKEVRDMIDES